MRRLSLLSVVSLFLLATSASAAGSVSMQSLLDQGYHIVSGSPEQILVLEKDKSVFICESENAITYQCHAAH